MALTVKYSVFRQFWPLIQTRRTL